MQAGLCWHRLLTPRGTGLNRSLVPSGPGYRIEPLVGTIRCFYREVALYASAAVGASAMFRVAPYMLRRPAPAQAGVGSVAGVALSVVELGAPMWVHFFA